jgi:ABC-type glutathione transport system ATPase component
MPGAALLDVRDLCVERAGRTLLCGVSFTIREGEILGLCGDSGCGKTTLSLALLRMLPEPVYRVRGEILLQGRDLGTVSEREWEQIRGARIGYIFQDPLLALNPVLTIRTQLAEVLHAHRREGDPGKLLQMAGLPDAGRILQAYPHQLSGGERQRVTIAQALACKPALIIADEPFTALDGPRVVSLARLFRELCRDLGTSFLLISHTPGVLAIAADDVIRMHKGRIVARGMGSALRK